MPPAVVAAAPTRRARVLRERSRPRRPPRVQRHTTRPILVNYRGVATSWPFVNASTSPHDPENATPALTYLLNHERAFEDRKGDEDVATSDNCTERFGQPRRMFP